MGQKRMKIARRIGLAVLLLTACLFVLNFYLTTRLERYLKKELIERTARATDGFYTLAFDRLSVSFFNGELSLEGIRLKPDSTVFRKWAAVDSLPQTYVSTEIGLIDFKGLNLTWRWNFKRLHFNTFEIQAPHVQVYNTSSSRRTEKSGKQAATQTLYDVIAPYINKLSVGTLNLENARVSYIVQNQKTPIVYALDNVSFHAYGFQLDSTSFRSGKLLYCANFDFVTKQPQTLLTNNDFILRTDSIRLSTADSVIYIKNIRLLSKEEEWEKKHQRLSNYVNGQVQTVEVLGIEFQRKEALNYLSARSFDIVNSDIQVFNLINQKADSSVSALSLYDVISPVLHSISIDRIGIENSRLKYSLAVKDVIEEYQLDNLTFRADGFLIDTLSLEKYDLGYIRNFVLDATGIQGQMTARNHRFRIKQMSLNTEEGCFRLEGLQLNPLSVQTHNDYLAGRMDLLRIDGLRYDKGLSVGLLSLVSPRFRYYQVPSSSNAPGATDSLSNSQVDIQGLFGPFFRYLSIAKIDIRQASVALIEQMATDTIIYKLNDFNFFATRFLTKKGMGKDGKQVFRYGDVGFDFSHFDNYLPGKEYRLSIGKGLFSTRNRLLQLQDIRLTPQVGVGKQVPDTYVSLRLPQLQITGFQLPQRFPAERVHIRSFSVDSPDVELFRRSPRTVTERPAASSGADPLYRMLGHLTHQLVLDSFRIKEGHVHYINETAKQPRIEINQKAIHLAINGIHLDNTEPNFRVEAVRLQTRQLEIPLDNGGYHLKIGNLDMGNTYLKLDSLHLVSLYPKMEFAYRQPKHQDWFDVTVGRVALTGMDVPYYFSHHILKAKDLQVDHVVLQNLKNKKIEVPLHLVPMIYSGLQKAPLKLAIENVGIHNFSVVYEELAKQGTRPGKLYFTDLSGRFSGFTNIVSTPNQFIRLDAKGRLMGKGDFTATWMLPVDSLNDRFLLNGQVDSFDLTSLNEIIMPLAPVEIQSGWTKDLVFRMDASSQRGVIHLAFPYRNLKIGILKEKEGEVVHKAFFSRLANLLLKSDNPSSPEKKPDKLREVDIVVVRDPYHSTFNYLWQILQPALAESVGVSQKEQRMAKGAGSLFSKVKKFFGSLFLNDDTQQTGQVESLQGGDHSTP